MNAFCKIMLGFVFVLACMPPRASAAFSDLGEIAVTVQQNGDVITIDASLCAAVTAEEAWDVLTDFEHMAQIVSNLESSQVLARLGNHVVVSQRGRATRGPLSFSFDTVREVDLEPYSVIRAHLVGGTLKRFDGVTRLSSQAAWTRIVNHGEFVADVWVPPIIGVHFIEAETRKQFAEMRDEMIRRHRLSENDELTAVTSGSRTARACGAYPD